jgi:hypothetical protein
MGKLIFLLIISILWVPPTFVFAIQNNQSVQSISVSALTLTSRLKTTHPRLMSEEWIDQLTEWSQDESWEPWQRFKAFADSSFGDAYDAGRLFAKALMWKMGKGNSYLTEALNNFDSVINTVDSNNVDSIESRGEYIAYAYDLLYDQFSSASQKNAVDAFVQWQETVKTKTSGGFRPLQGWYLRPWVTAFIVAAAGAYDPSNVENNLDSEYYYWKTNYLYPMLYFLENVTKGPANMGTYYSVMKMPYILHAVDIVFMVEGEDIYNTNSWFHQAIVYLWQAYSIPYKMKDAKSSSAYGWYYHHWGQGERLRARVLNMVRLNILHLMTRLSEVNNPYRRQIYTYLYGNSDPDFNKAYYSKVDYTSLWAFLFGAKNLVTNPEAPSLRFWYTNKHKNLPVNDPNYEYGPGYGFMRTGYTSDDIYVSFKCGDMIGRNHENLEDGTFQLFAKGEDLAIHSGAYDGDGRASQTRDYFMRTVSMNGIIIYDPNEQFSYKNYSTEKGTIDNTGGQRYYYAGPQAFSASDGRVESMFEHWVGEDKYTPNPWGHNIRAKLLKADHIDDKYSYIFCDVTRAYNSDEYVEGASAGNTSKVSKVTREMALVGNKYFIVFDRVVKKHPTDYSATPKEGEPYPYQDKWLLHSPALFTVNGAEIIVSDGEQLYTNTDGSFYTFVKNFSQDGAYLYGKVVYPDKDFQIRRFNGAKQYWNYQKNVPQPYGWTKGADWGKDRLEIEPIDTDLEHHYLVVLYPAKPTEPAMPQVERISSSQGTMLGALIQDTDTPQIILFSKDNTEKTQLSYEASYTGLGKHTITGLASGTYDVYKDGVKILTSVTASSEGVLSFDSTGGSTFGIVQTGQVPPPIKGDLNNDKKVNSLDYSLLINKWFQTTNIEKEDLNQDGKVDARDLGIMMSNWTG